MCQKKPGPRCASHLRERLTAVQAHVDANKAAWHNAAADLPYPGAEYELVMIQDEYDETPTGQDELAAQAAASNDPRTTASLTMRRDQAARRYAIKTAALDATNRGDERGANIVLKTGNPHTAWLSGSRLNPLNSDTYARMRISPSGQHMVGVLTSETHPHPSGAHAVVDEHHTIYETPVRRGTSPGTWVTEPVDGIGRVVYTPADIDHPHATLRPLDPTGAPTGASLTIGHLDTDDQLDALTGYRSTPNAAAEWDPDIEIIETRDGHAILRDYGTVTIVHAPSEDYIGV